ncbi:MAG: hypothetical protein WCS42_27485 [Verrucomicrobiota bacterium]
MRIAYFDSADPEVYFDNPNLRWGDPSYLLEPGDPGYVGPVPPNNENKPKKGKKMKRQRYYPIRVADQIVWLTNFSNKIGDEAAVLGLSQAAVAAIKADCLWLIYVLQEWLPATRTWAQSCTDAASAAMSGSGGLQVLPVFTPPVLPVGAVPVNLGALDRIFALVQQIKTSGKSTDTIDTNLGIVGSEAGAPDYATLTPVFTVEVLNGQAVVKWGWQGFGAWLDSCEIWVDRGDGKGFGFLTIDTTPGYADTQPLPAAPAKWSYKAVFRVGDAHAGNWSAPVSLNVGG